MKSRDRLLPTAFYLSFPLHGSVPLPLQRLVLCLPRLPTLNRNVLLILNEHIFAGKISGDLFISGQHY